MTFLVLYHNYSSLFSALCFHHGRCSVNLPLLSFSLLKSFSVFHNCTYCGNRYNLSLNHLKIQAAGKEHHIIIIKTRAAESYQIWGQVYCLLQNGLNHPKSPEIGKRRSRQRRKERSFTSLSGSRKVHPPLSKNPSGSSLMVFMILTQFKL